MTSDILSGRVMAILKWSEERVGGLLDISKSAVSRHRLLETILVETEIERGITDTLSCCGKKRRNSKKNQWVEERRYMDFTCKCIRKKYKN